MGKIELSEYKTGFIKRLKHAFKLSDKKKKHIAKEVGVSYNTVMKWFRSGSISRENIEALAICLACDKVWLMTGENTLEIRELPEKYKTDRDIMIPVYDVQLSSDNNPPELKYIETEKKLPFDSQWLQKNKLNPRYLKVLYVYGDSMLPSMSDGDTVLIDTSKTKIIDRKIYAVVIGGEPKIKRLKQKFDGAIEVISDNPVHGVETIPTNGLDHLLIIGQAVYRSGLL